MMFLARCLQVNWCPDTTVDVLWTYKRSNWSSSLYLLMTIHQRCLQASDKSVDLQVKRIEFRDETSDRDGLSIINIDFDFTRASFNSSRLQNYYKLLHFGSIKPAKRFNFLSTVPWLAGDVVAQRRDSSEAFFHKLLIIYSHTISRYLRCQFYFINFMVPGLY